jgi:coenzyme F420-reducing hydrogenase alpha subunit
MSDRSIDINVPVLARVEGEGALDLRIENNAITELKLRIYEPPRYFEKFLEGRSYRDVPDTVARICGICPVAYQMSAIHAIDSIFQVTASPWVRDMRRLLYCGEWLQSHNLHIHMLAAPDFLGFNSVIEMATDFADEVRRGLKLQGLGNAILRLLGGRSVHPVGVCAGGFFHAPVKQDVNELLERCLEARQDAVDLVRWTASLDLADDEQDFTSVSLHHPDEYAMNEGRIVSDHGLDIGIDEFDDHFREIHMPQSTALHCLLHDKPYLVGPLARLNNNLDQLPADSRKLLEQTGIAFPSRNMFHSIVARAVEVHFALNEAIRLLETYQLPDHTFQDLNVRAGVGYGCTEAPRGILWHRYELDAEGHVVSARIVPPTSQNQSRIEQDIANALNHFGLDQDDASLQLHAEKVIRNYDPCISCATHFLKLNVYRACAHTAITPRPAATAVPAIPTVHGPLTLIAIGSPFEPDNLAWDLVDLLQEDEDIKARLNSDLTVIKLDRPGTGLLSYLHQQDQVWLLDVVPDYAAEDHFLCIKGEQFTNTVHALSSHDIGVLSALQLSRALGQDLHHVTVLGIPLGNNANTLSLRVKLDRLRLELKSCILAA